VFSKEMYVRLRGSSLSSFLPLSRSVSISYTVAHTLPLRKRALPIGTCHHSPVGLAFLLCSSPHSFLFSLFLSLFFFFFYVFPSSAWWWHHIPAPLYLRAPHRQLSFLSPHSGSCTLQ
jgi:hypothetical protein